MLCSERDAAVANLKHQIDLNNTEIGRKQDRLPGLGPIERAQEEKEIADLQQEVTNIDLQILQLERQPCD